MRRRAKLPNKNHGFGANFESMSLEDDFFFGEQPPAPLPGRGHMHEIDEYIGYEENEDHEGTNAFGDNNQAGHRSAAASPLMLFGGGGLVHRSRSQMGVGSQSRRSAFIP